MKIALVQQHATRDREGNVRRGLEAFKIAAESGAELIAFAELAFYRFLPQCRATPDDLKKAESIPGPTTERFARLAKEYGVVAVLNTFESDGERSYDASPIIDADGTLLGVIRMVHIMDGLGFYEKGFYTPGDKKSFVYKTRVGRVGVSICYDRHYPEYMRNLALQGAELVVVPQAGALGEWPDGIFEAELQVAAFQNGYFAALVNRVGKEEKLHFSGGSYVVDPFGKVISRAPQGEDFILYAECDLGQISKSPARRFFIKDRRPDFYRKLALDAEKEVY
jgi:beta-ureidopropionase